MINHNDAWANNAKVNFNSYNDGNGFAIDVGPGTNNSYGVIIDLNGISFYYNGSMKWLK